jgi:hypothetical protein
MAEQAARVKYAIRLRLAWEEEERSGSGGRMAAPQLLLLHPHVSPSPSHRARLAACQDAMHSHYGEGGVDGKPVLDLTNPDSWPTDSLAYVRGWSVNLRVRLLDVMYVYHQCELVSLLSGVADAHIG